MGMISYISAVVVLCFTVSLFNAISGDTNIDCSTLDNTTCCVNAGCYYINCTDKANTTLTHEGCHTFGNTTEIDQVCVKDTFKTVCDGPTPGTCEVFQTNETCCNNATAPDCSWINCTDITSGKIHQGCHNSSDTGTIGKVCKAGTSSETCAAAPVVTPCTDYTTNQTKCCGASTRGCIFVNCTQDKKTFKGCFLKAAVTCASPIDQCTLTTAAPTSPPTTTPIPLSQRCHLYNNSASCCSELDYKCISVNCTSGGTTYKGCYSSRNETEIKTACGAAYLDSCAATTPVPPTTAAPGGKTGRHFDGASFIGGIVLCAGIVLIIFFAIKWYKSRQTSNNYHQM